MSIARDDAFGWIWRRHSLTRRSRDGLPKSYHGNAGTATEDLVVHTEFGADAWTYLVAAGFANISIHPVAYPAAMAFSAR